MARTRFQNMTQVMLRDVKPGAVFRAEAENDVPTDSYWRRRLSEGAIALYTGPAVPNAAPEVPPPPAPAAPVSRPARSKKDA